MSLIHDMIITDEYGFDVEATPMNELRTITPFRLVGGNYNNGSLDTTYWTSTVTGSGANTVANAQLTQATGTTANSTVAIQSNRVGRYIGGSSNRYRGIVRQPTTGTANNIRRWGMFTTTDGAFFELNGTTLNVVTRKTSSDTAVAAASWNGTTFTMDTNVHTYEIYMTNSKVYFVIDSVLRHTVSATTTTWTDSMNLPARSENRNSGGSTTAVTQEVRVQTIYRLGSFETQPLSFRQSGTTAGVTVKTGAGNLHGLIISSITNNANVTLYDNTAASGTIIFTTGAMAANTIPFDLELHTIPFSNGLTLVISGANCDVLVVFE